MHRQVAAILVFFVGLALWAATALAQESYLYLATQRRSTGPVGHSVAGVTTPDKAGALFVHQVGHNRVTPWTLLRGGFSTTIQKASGHPYRSDYTTYRLKVTDAQAQSAWQLARQLSNTRPGRFHPLKNNCATTAAQVLEAAGQKPPRWARSFPALLQRWFKSNGATKVSGTR